MSRSASVAVDPPEELTEEERRVRTISERAGRPRGEPEDSLAAADADKPPPPPPLDDKDVEEDSLREASVECEWLWGWRLPDPTLLLCAADGPVEVGRARLRSEEEDAAAD